MKKRKIRNFIMAIVDIFVVLIVIYFIIGYINFYNLSNDKKPLFVVKENDYTTTSGDKVNIYDNVIYKIVKQEKPGKSISYSLKLWFMDDIKD